LSSTPIHVCLPVLAALALWTDLAPLATQATDKLHVPYTVYEIEARRKRVRKKTDDSSPVPRPWTLLPVDSTSIRVAGIEIGYEIKHNRLRVQRHGHWVSARPGEVLDLGEKGKPSRVGFRRQAETWFVTAGKVASFVFDEQRFTGVDLDGDGRYFTPNVDGILFADTCRIAPTPRFLVTPYGQFRWTEKKCELELETATKKDWPYHYYHAVWRLNQVRNYVGLAPVRLGEELCAGCDAHADYVNLNQAWLQEQAARGNVSEGHNERKDREGYSEIGDQAGRSSVIAFRKASAADAVDEFVATFYHRQSLLNLLIDRVGIGLRKGTCLIDILRGTMPQGSGPKLWKRAGVALGDGRLIVWPPAGMADVPVHFNRWGEIPHPWPEKDQNGDKRGYPVTVLFVSPEQGRPMRVSKFEIELRQRKRKIRGHKIWPEGPLAVYHGPREYGFVPSSPLRQRKTYTAKVSFEHAGRKLEYEWKFRTVD